MLKLVLGRAGYGKTNYVFTSIKKLIEDGEENILLITPEQFSFYAERRLLTELGEENINKVESSSFSRLSNDITKRYGGEYLPTLSNGAKAVKMKEAIETVQELLELFDKKKLNVSFIDSIVKIYDEMKSCRVSSDDLLKVSDNTQHEILKRKLHDVALIFTAYDSLIENEFYDSADELTRLYEKLLSLTYFKDRTVFIDGFNGFVAQEYKVLEVILQQAKCVYITFCTDSFNDNDYDKNKYDLFSYVNNNIRILYDVAKDVGVQVAEPIKLSIPYRFNNDELKKLEKFAFSNKKETEETVPENVSFFAAKSINDECDRVSLEISRLLRQGYKAKDITVICRDLDKYERELAYSFDKFNIPYFADERQSINSQPLIMLVNFLLRVVIYSYRNEDIISLIKTGLINLDDTKISELENYAYIWNINGSAWKKEFTNSTKGFTDSIDKYDAQKLESINKSREYVVGILNSFAKKTKNATVEDICKAIYTAIIAFSADKKLTSYAKSLEENGKSALANEQGRIWDMLMDVLDKLVLVSGDKNVSLKDFYKLFHLMISNEDLGSIPMGLDNVQFGSADRIRCDNPRAVFVIGANEGEFPKSIVSAGLFTESDRMELIQNKFKLYSYGETLNSQERYFAYMAVCAASDKVFVSYIKSGDNPLPGSIISGIKGIFKNIPELHSVKEKSLEDIESRANAFEILSASYSENNELIKSLDEYFQSDDDYKSKLNALKSVVEDKDMSFDDSNTATELYGKDLRLSASKIDNFYSCAFRYFLSQGLNASVRKKVKLDALKTGTVVHYVLQQIISETGSEAFKTLDNTEIKELVKKHLEVYLTTKMGDTAEFSARFEYQFRRLANMIYFVVIRLRDEFAQSDFNAVAFELYIGDGEKGVPAKEITLPDGGKITITGSVDRVDTYEENGVKYLRVVDYKSKNMEFNLTNVLYGLNLQMLLYLFTVAESNSEYAGITGGVLYMNSSRKVYNVEAESDLEKINTKTNDAFKMNGIILEDDEHKLAEHMEHNLNGVYIPVEKDKKHNDILIGNMVTLEQLGRISRKIDERIVNMGLSLHNGYIIQNPIEGNGYNNSCEYCDFKDICKNRTDIEVKKLQSLENEEVIRIIEEEQDGSKLD